MFSSKFGFNFRVLDEQSVSRAKYIIMYMNHFHKKQSEHRDKHRTNVVIKRTATKQGVSP